MTNLTNNTRRSRLMRINTIIIEPSDKAVENVISVLTALLLTCFANREYEELMAEKKAEKDQQEARDKITATKEGRILPVKAAVKIRRKKTLPRIEWVVLEQRYSRLSIRRKRAMVAIVAPDGNHTPYQGFYEQLKDKGHVIRAILDCHNTRFWKDLLRKDFTETDPIGLVINCTDYAKYNELAIQPLPKGLLENMQSTAKYLYVSIGRRNLTTDEQALAYLAEDATNGIFEGFAQVLYQKFLKSRNQLVCLWDVLDQYRDVSRIERELHKNDPPTPAVIPAKVVTMDKHIPEEGKERKFKA